MKIKLFIISMLLLLCAGCQTVQTILKPALAEEGEIFVYIQPLPQEANGLRFNLEGIYAVRNDGVEVPLTLSLAEFKGSDAKRQRFVASGTLQPGVYRGLSFKASKAWLQGVEREIELPVSDKRETCRFFL